MNSDQKIRFSALITLIVPFVIIALIPWGDSIIINAVKVAFIFIAILSIFIWKEQIIDWIIVENSQSSEHVSDSEKYTSELGNIYSDWVESTLRSASSFSKDAKSALYFIEPENRSLALQANADQVFKNSISLDNKFVQMIFGQKATEVYQEKDKRPEWATFFTNQTWRGSEVAICAPIKYKKRVTGCLILFFDHFNMLNPNFSISLNALSDLFTKGLDRIDQNEKLIYEILLQEKVIEFVLNVKMPDPIDVTLNKFITLAQSFFTYDQFTISLIDKESGLPMIAATDGNEATISPGVHIDNQNAFHNWLYKNKDIVVINEFEKEFSGSRFGIDKEKEVTINSVLAVPVLDEDRILGMVVLERVKLQPFTERDKNYAGVVANILSNIIPEHNTFQQIQRNATQDGLTGLLNRRVFDDRIKDELARAKRFDQFITIVIFDLDKFKRINDTYGHVYGDYVIRTTAQIIKSSIRNIDIAARYGGEEFVLILVNTDKRHSNIVVDRIVKSIANHDFNKDGIQVKMTISAGLSDFPEDGEGAKELIEFADQALYKTKEKGGNGFTAYDASFSQ